MGFYLLDPPGSWVYGVEEVPCAYCLGSFSASVDQDGLLGLKGPLSPLSLKLHFSLDIHQPKRRHTMDLLGFKGRKQGHCKTCSAITTVARLLSCFWHGQQLGDGIWPLDRSTSPRNLLRLGLCILEQVVVFKPQAPHVAKHCWRLARHIAQGSASRNARSGHFLLVHSASKIVSGGFVQAGFT